MSCADCNHREIKQCVLRDEPLTDLNYTCFMDSSIKINKLEKKRMKEE